MGTRGLWGYIIGEDEKLTYNHFDSYPSGLGVDLLKWLRETPLDEVRAQAAALRMVDGDTEAPVDEQERLVALGTHSGAVSSGQSSEWYSLLRNAQGDPALTNAAGVMIEYADFALDSLFCEWAYVIDLEAGFFEVYRGFQTEPHEEGRFAKRSEGSGGYFPVRLMAAYRLTELPDDETFLAQTEKVAYAEEDA